MKSALYTGALVVGVALAIVAAGCGGSQKETLQRADRGLAIALQATSAARDGFTAWDKAHQDQIVRDAESLEAGKAALAHYWTQREPVLKAFVLAYSSIALASSALALYDAGRVGEMNVIQKLQEAAAAVEAVLRAVKLLGGTP